VSDFDATMEALRQRFIARCAADLVQLREHQDGFRLSPEALRTIVHRMAGSAGLFGFAEIGALAGKLDGSLADTGDAAMLPELVASLEPLILEHRR
jgi:HPt (histidine-containing phosphotransfer) domain-containing protein